MSIDIKALTITAILGVVLFTTGYYKGYSSKPQKTVTKSDTVEVVKTIREPIPPPQQIKLVEYIFIPVTDTVRINDTLLVSIPREQRTYSTDSYTAVISGFMPTLDYIETYNLTRTVTNTVIEPRRRWGFSAGVGTGVIFSPFYKGFDAGIGIFAGATYSF